MQRGREREGRREGGRIESERGRREGEGGREEGAEGGEMVQGGVRSSLREGGRKRM